MAETYVPFTGIKPAAGTPTVLYTAPAATTSMGAAIHACNITKAGAGADDSIRVWRVQSGGSTANPTDANALIMDMVVDQFDPYIMNSPIVLNTGDSIVVYSTNGNVAFNGSTLEMT